MIHSPSDPFSYREYEEKEGRSNDVKVLQKRVLRLEEGRKEIRNGLHCHTIEWLRCRINEVLKSE